MNLFSNRTIFIRHNTVECKIDSKGNVTLRNLITGRGVSTKLVEYMAPSGNRDHCFNPSNGCRLVFADDIGKVFA